MRNTKPSAAEQARLSAEVKELLDRRSPQTGPEITVTVGEFIEGMRTATSAIFDSAVILKDVVGNVEKLILSVSAISLIGAMRAIRRTVGADTEVAIETDPISMRLAIRFSCRCPLASLPASLCTLARAAGMKLTVSGNDLLLSTDLNFTNRYSIYNPNGYVNPFTAAIEYLL